MRDSLRNLINQTITIKYSLPNTSANIDKIKHTHTNRQDDCYAHNNHDALVEIIYNSIIEYAFSSQDLAVSDYTPLLARALHSKLRYDENSSEATKLKRGFFGEVLLDCVLKAKYGTDAIVSRGYFYNVLGKTETAGFDSFHIIDKPGQPELWLGEVKFYVNIKPALQSPDSVNPKTGVMDKIEYVLSDEYLKNHLIALSEYSDNFDTVNQTLKDIANRWKTQAVIDLQALVDANFKLVYPIFLIYDDKSKTYDTAISEIVAYLNTEIADKNISNSLPATEIFFILLPLSNAQQVKKDVIQWISDKKQLLS
jgi:hypothetical protein